MTELKKIIPSAENICNDVPIIICFGHAGSYGGVFRNWINAVENMAILPVELPREKKIFDDIVKLVAESLAPFLRERCYCIFGHSMGAVFAFETEYILENEYGICAKEVFVCGRHSPDLDKKEFYNTSMNNDRLILEIKRLGGTNEELLEKEEYTNVIIPFIKNDYRIHESYKYCGHKVSCPLEVNLGMTDVSVSIADISGWKNMTNRDFTRKLFDGGHFFLYDDMKYFKYLQGRCRKIFGF